MITRTRLARTLFWISGRLCKYIKVPQRTWAVELGDPQGDFSEMFKTTFAGWRWGAPSWALKIGFIWAYRCDPHHYDHWALDHSGHEAVECEECGGQICERPTE